jgi:hypothetical protein
MTKEQEILETYCTFSGMVYSKYQVDAYGIKPTPPNYDISFLEELKLKSDIIKNKIVEYLSPAAFEYIQIEQAETWTIIHDLGWNPRVLAVDSEDKQIEGIIMHTITGTTLTLTFTLPVCGKAFLF